MQYKKFKLALGISLGLVLAGTAVVSTAANAQSPKGTVPFGVYDPDGDFSIDQAVTVEHLFLPWEDVYLPSLYDADAYALERQRSLLVTVEPWTWSRSERNTARYLKNGIFPGRMIQTCRQSAKSLEHCAVL